MKIKKRIKYDGTGASQMGLDIRGMHYFAVIGLAETDAREVFIISRQSFL